MSAHIIIGPQLVDPIEYKTLGEFFFKNCEKYADRICQIDGTSNTTETYGSVKQRTTRLAIALQKKGLTSSDVITLCVSNSLDAVIPIIAGLYLGAKTSNLDASLSKRHIKHLLSLVTPRVIFVDESSVDLIEESLIGADFKPEIIVFGHSNKYTQFSQLLQPQQNEENFSPRDINPDDLAVMFFSSGTTGLPKAICHSHRTFLSLTDQSYHGGWRNAVFHCTTFYWMTAMILLSCSFKNGSYRVFCRDPTADSVFRIIHQHKVEFMFMAPLLTYQLTNFENSDKYDTSSLKVISCGGAPMAASQIEKMNLVFKNTFISQVYGMSEIGVISSLVPETDREVAARKIASVGKLVPEFSLKVVDLTSGEALGANQKGEIHVHAPSLMKGYYRGDSSQIFDEDGFLKTGDVGYYDDDGFIYIEERIKEMFKYQSWHIVPSAIEVVLLEHAAIKDASVFGLDAGEDGEVPAACIALKEGTTLTEEEIDGFLRERVADRERLRGGVTFVGAIPKTPTGKVVRQQVKDFVINLQKKM